MFDISIYGYISILVSLLAIILSILVFRTTSSNRKKFWEGMAKLEEARDNLTKSNERLKKMNDELDRKLGIGEE